MGFLIRVLVNALAIWLATEVVPGIEARSVTTVVVAALVLGLVNAFVRPILVILTLPATLLTLGLFIFVLNGLLFLGVANLLEGFYVAGFWPAVFGAILFSLVSWLLSALVLR